MDTNGIADMRVVVTAPEQGTTLSQCQITDGVVAEKKVGDDSASLSIPAENPPLPLATLCTSSTALLATSRLNKTHPLKTSWTFWYLDADKEKEWLERLHEICAIDTAEKFWSLFDNIRPPTSMPHGSDYNFFKKGIQPVWEVEENKKGGRLVIQVEKGKYEHLDILWLELLVALVGEQFGEDSDQICGAVCNIRTKGHKISLWTKDVEAEDVNRRIGGIVKNRFQDIVKGNIRVNYEEHNYASQKNSSALHVRFFL